MSNPGSLGTTAGMEPIIEELGEAEALSLIERAEVGRIGFTGRYGQVVLPVNFKVVDGSVVFRTEEYGALGEDLRTGIPGAEYQVAFEVDELDAATRTGWSVILQGGLHHVEDEAERAVLAAARIEPWAGGERSLYVRIKPLHITGRRIARR